MDAFSSALLQSYVCQNNNLSPWIQLGPYTNPLGAEEDHGDIGRIHGIWVNPSNHNNVIVGSHPNGLFETTDGGQSWADMLIARRYPGIDVEQVHINPSNHSEVYIVSSRYMFSYGLFKSTNSGANWDSTFATRPQGTYGPSQIVRKVQSLPTPNFDHMYAITSNRLLRSSTGFENNLVDCGLVPGNYLLFDLDVSSVDTNLVFVSGTGLVKYDGTTFTDLTGNLNVTGTLIECRVVLDNTNSLILYTLVTDAQGVSLQKSTNGGGSFTILKQTTIKKSYGQFEQSINNSSTFYWGGINPYMFTYDSGTWKNLSIDNLVVNANNSSSNDLHADIRGISVVDNGAFDKVYFGHDGGISIFDLSDTTYSHIHGKGLNIGDGYGISINPFAGYLYMGMEHVGTHRYNFNERTWKKISDGDGGQPVNNPFNLSEGLLGLNDCILELTNNETVTVGSAQPPTYSSYPNVSGSCAGNFDYYYKPIEADKVTPNLYYAGYESVLSYNSNTDSWIDLFPSANYMRLGKFDKIKAERDGNKSIVYASNTKWANPNGLDTLLYKMTFDAGETLTIVPIPNNFFANISAIEIDPNDPDHIWIGSGGIIGSYYNEEKKLFVTSNSGSTWTDITNGLPDFSINDIEFDPVSNIVYAALDIGVWYRDLNLPSGQQSWICYNNQLPAVVVENIDINPCRRTLIAGTYGRGAYEVKLIGSSEYYSWVNITSDSIISDTVSSSTHLRITNNSTVTITGELRMAYRTWIYVEPGSKLVVNGGKITNECGALWRGIKAWGEPSPNPASNGGRPTYSQYQTNKHGIVELKNNAVIENAIVGVTLGGNPDSAGINGGILLATNTVFRNNYRDVKFLRLKNFSSSNPAKIKNNVSHLVNCDFRTTKELADNVLNEPFAHLSMYGVKGVKIKACKFTDSIALDSNIRTWNDMSRIGIFSVNSVFNIDPLCSSNSNYATSSNSPCLTDSTADSNIFFGLNQGIRVANTNPVNPVSIRGGRFIDNHVGVRIIGAKLAEVYRNDFFVPDRGNATGLYLQGSTDYYVEANNFYGPGVTTSNGPRGIVVNMSKDNPNEVVNNYFEDFRTAAELSDDNDGALDQDGLQYRCNEMVSSQFDIRVTGYDVGNDIVDIGLNQGFCDAFNPDNSNPVMNKLQSSCSGSKQLKVLKNSNQQINYTHFNNQSAYEPDCYTASKVTKHSCGNSSNPISNYCTLDDKSNPRGYEGPAWQNRVKINDLNDSITTGDDTISAKITNDAPDQEIVDLVELYRAFISDATVEKLINDKPTPMVDNKLLEALEFVSPISADNEVELQNRSMILFTNYQGYVTSNGLTYSPRESTDWRIESLERHIKKMHEETMRYWLLYDTSGLGLDSVLSFLDTLTGSDYKLKMAYLYMDNEMITEADSIFTLYGDSGDFYDHFVDWNEIYVELAGDSSYEGLIIRDSLLKVDVENLSASAPSDIPVYNALNMLSLVFKDTVHMPMYAEEEGGGSSKRSYNERIEDDFEEYGTEYLSLFPNPAEEIVNISYILRSDLKSWVSVYNLNGIHLSDINLKQSQNLASFGVQDLQSGTYIFILYDGGEFVARKKLTVAH